MLPLDGTTLSFCSPAAAFVPLTILRVLWTQTPALLLRSEAGSSSCSGREPPGALGTKKRALRRLPRETWTYWCGAGI